jgi:hypothetical protein
LAIALTQVGDTDGGRSLNPRPTVNVNGLVVLHTLVDDFYRRSKLLFKEMMKTIAAIWELIERNDKDKSPYICGLYKKWTYWERTRISGGDTRLPYKP